MNGISFCIVTSGKEDHQLQKTIDSIELLDIPNYEILFVGGDSTTIELINKRKWIPFNEYGKSHVIVDNKPGIELNKKKNLVVRNATYDICVVLHDYILFNQNWWIEFEKFGYHWDICIHQVLNYLGARAEGFRIDRHPLLPRGIAAPYDMIDLIQYSGLQGNYQCIKKQCWLEEPMNEDLLWGQGDEMEWNRRIIPKFHTRINPNCIAQYSKPKPCDHREATLDVEVTKQYEKVFSALRECRMENFKMYYEEGFNNNDRTIFL